jgi:hypothetical protein
MLIWTVALIQCMMRSVHPIWEGRTIMAHHTGKGLCRGGFSYDANDEQVTRYIAALQSAVNHQGTWGEFIFSILPATLIGGAVIGLITGSRLGSIGWGVGAGAAVVVLWYIIGATGNSINNWQFRHARSALQAAERVGRIHRW